MKRIIAMLIATTLLVTGCGARTAGADESAAAPENTPEDRQETEEPAMQEQNPAEESAIPGSYTVPEGWIKAEEYSTKEKIFYVEEGHENDTAPDNISVNVGTNKYGADEHMKFRDAIVRQLMMQLQGVDAQLTGDGTYTQQDYVVYIFTIEESDVVTKQYYIVGDHRYCLIHLTNYTGSENADNAAQTIADSFVWDD